MALSIARLSEPHIHLVDHCPTCDQPIPNSRLEEVAKRIAARDQQLREEADARLNAEVQSAIDAEKTRSVAREETARQEARAALAAEMSGKLAEAEKQKTAMEAKMAEILLTQQAELDRRVGEMRETMEKQKEDAVSAANSRSFEETEKLKKLVEELKRKLENKTATELGEGAEVDLLEALKAEFPEDDIKRVGPGKPGVDIIHKVRHNGYNCGTIVYDSKNHKQWRNDFVTKLRQDQISERAEHAVLSTLVFPRDKKQLDIDSGVILANPARAIVVAMILRKQLVQVHTLKMSNEERSRKTDELYALMTSDRFEQFIATIKRTTEQLEAMQAKERKSHEDYWKKQGEFFRAITRNCVQFDAEIARIIGTA